MSQKDRENSRLRRAKRLAIRLGLHVMVCQKPDKRVLAHGGYMLRDGATMKIVFGDAEYLFSASLDEIEAWLDEREG
ncbi:MAG: hypothetical protein ACRDBL_08095 [Rhabdaerophilum sp.]